MEVRTYLLLLEKFQKFACYCSRENFLSFLNSETFDIESSSFSGLMTMCPSLDCIRRGKEPQMHVNFSLRNLEEKYYQLKKRLYVVHIETNDILLLKLREQFERFYGPPGETSRFKFLYGVGLKPLEHALTKSPDIFKMRFKEAEFKLENLIATADERDYLVYLGARIIDLSNQATGQDKCSEEDYRTLLRYSSRLLDIQISTKSTDRLYLESFLYHAMLHWPLQNRTTLNLADHVGPESYSQNIERWEHAFNDNFYLTSVDRRRKAKPKNFFALGKGSPGNDLVDLNSIKRKWERQKGRKHVYRDYFWREQFVRERLLRLDGTVDGSGHVILHKVVYPQHGSKEFRIKTYYPCNRFSNRMVTFVLGFTWKGPTAFDVSEKGREEFLDEDIEVAREAGGVDEENLDEDDGLKEDAVYRGSSQSHEGTSSLKTGNAAKYTETSVGNSFMNKSIVSSMSLSKEEKVKTSDRRQGKYEKEGGLTSSHTECSKPENTSSAHDRQKSEENAIDESRPFHLLCDSQEEGAVGGYLSEETLDDSAGDIDTSQGKSHKGRQLNKPWMKPQKKKHRKRKK